MKSLITNTFFGLLFLVSTGVLVFGGCGSSEKTEKKENGSLKEFLVQSEKDFNPATYDKNVEDIKQEASGRLKVVDESKRTSLATSDTVSGFRVQVLFTQEIEVANNTRDTLNTLLPAEYVYVVYDPPYYKVRVGNYQERAAANDMLKNIIGKGYNEAWVVPDNIITNLPKKQEIPSTEIKEQDQHQ